MRRTRARYGLHGAVEGMANNERGLRQSRTPHARSSCIIGHFLTIAWGTQILAIGDSQVRSYDRRTVSVEWSVRRANCKRFTHIRPTDGSGPTTVGWSGERRSQWRCIDRLRCPTLRRFQSRLVSSFYSFEFLLKTKHSTVNCQPLRSFSPSSRLETDCFTSKLTRMMSRVRALSGYGRRICA